MAPRFQDRQVLARFGLRNYGDRGKRCVSATAELMNSDIGDVFVGQFRAPLALHLGSKEGLSRALGA